MKPTRSKVEFRFATCPMCGERNRIATFIVTDSPLERGKELTRKVGAGHHAHCEYCGMEIMAVLVDTEVL